jgi:hypothetical protein
VWRHPALKTREPSWWEGKTSIVAKSYSLKNASVKIRDYINDTENKVTSNGDNLDIIRFICDFYDFYAAKLETHFYLRRKLRLDEISEALNEDDSDTLKLEIEREEIENTLGSIDLQGMIDNDLTELKKLKTGYRQIWITYYKEANLNLIEDKFDRLISYFEEIKSELAEDSLADPLIASKWIYCGNKEGGYYPKSVFSKEIKISGNILNAHLQLMGDSYAKLYINGDLIDEVYARRSGSLYTESKRIKYIDISKYIRSGNNVFEVRAESFSSNPAAGFNLIAEIQTDEGNINLLSDESWLAKPMDSDSGWQNAVSKPYRYEVVAPNFKTGRPSWIER